MLDWIGVFFNLFGCFLNAKKKILCWPIWLIGNVIWIAYWYPKSEWAALILTFVYSAINVYGYICWRKPKENQNKKNSYNWNGICRSNDIEFFQESL